MPRYEPWSAALSRAVRELYPGYFAMVMATGIVSIAAGGVHLAGISAFLLGWAAVSYAVLFLLLAVRALRFPANLAADLGDAAKNPGFLTFVAGTDMLGSRLALAGQPAWSAGLLALGLLSWIALVYYLFAVDTFRNTRSPGEVISGTWLLLTVATQSVAVLAALLAPRYAGWAGPVLFGAWCFWGVGVFLYAVVIGFIIYRFFFYPVDPRDVTPPYWINMGAVAISVLAGDHLALAAPGDPLLGGLRPFLLGLTVLLWAWGTWWIPLLVIMGVWRHLVRRVPLTYHPAFWGMVFPLGMYTAATAGLGQVLHLPFLVVFAGEFLWVALAAWTATAVGFLWSNLRALNQPRVPS